MQIFECFLLIIISLGVSSTEEYCSIDGDKNCRENSEKPRILKGNLKYFDLFTFIVRKLLLNL